jgi:hypothetical protein
VVGGFVDGHVEFMFHARSSNSIFPFRSGTLESGTAIASTSVERPPGAAARRLESDPEVCIVGPFRIGRPR